MLKIKLAKSKNSKKLKFVGSERSKKNRQQQHQPHSFPQVAHLWRQASRSLFWNATIVKIAQKYLFIVICNQQLFRAVCPFSFIFCWFLLFHAFIFNFVFSHSTFPNLKRQICGNCGKRAFIMIYGGRAIANWDAKKALNA